MTEHLATYLKSRVVAALPFLDRAVGLARPYAHTIGNGEDTRRVTLPLPVAFTPAECEADPRYLVPDAETAAILFFEDGGTVSRGAAGPVYERTLESTVRLLLWVNPFRLSAQLPETALVAALHRALRIGTRQQTPELADLLLSWTIQPAGAALFSAYSYAAETPLLYPPFRVFGAEIRAVYRFTPACLAYALPTRLPVGAECPPVLVPAPDPTITNFTATAA